ncbi:hypothetical protein [Pedobacter jejuensis]|uniref:Uncharacterized protein n=1 Tax=Pedobacter jejuensis TaxID=1268550 RepID=A0A3N0BNB4_9SPHI|nr:hypothetical protein [Pedobacter jejuensis]RNL50196.1 hypothetical protein D7004_18470 [Pedobacter jejuensis]
MAKPAPLFVASPRYAVGFSLLSGLKTKGCTTIITQSGKADMLCIRAFNYLSSVDNISSNGILF